MRDKIKVAVVGVGFIGYQHIESIRRIPNTEIVAFVVPTKAEADKISRETGITNYYLTVEDLLANETDLDVVHNCTPSGEHYRINKLVIQAGINIYCEKPFTLTSRESEELVALLESTDLKGAVNFNYRHNLMVMEMKERIEQQAIGNVWFVQAEYLQDWLLFQEDYDWRIDASLGGQSRAIADIGSHCFDTLQYLLGKKISSIQARNYKKFDTRLSQGIEKVVENEDASIILVTFEDGTDGLIRLSQVTPGKKNDFHILVEGDRESLEWYQEQPDRLRIGRRNEPNQEVYASKQYLTGQASQAAILPNGHAVGWADAFTQGIKCFYQSLQGEDKGGYVTFAEAHYIMKLVDACLESHRTNCRVEII